MNYNSIPEKDQGEVLVMLWSMLREEEERARNGSVFDKRRVENGYRLWNRVTGDKSVPVWENRKVPL